MPREIDPVVYQDKWVFWFIIWAYKCTHNDKKYRLSKETKIWAWSGNCIRQYKKYTRTLACVYTAYLNPGEVNGKITSHLYSDNREWTFVITQPLLQFKPSLDSHNTSSNRERIGNKQSSALLICLIFTSMLDKLSLRAIHISFSPLEMNLWSSIFFFYSDSSNHWSF